jgi:hypothetical protein
MRTQESKISVCESSKWQDNRVRECDAASSSEALELQRKIVLAHLATQGQLDINLRRKPAEENCSSMQSHGMHHDGHKHLCYVKIFAVDTA